MDAPTIADFKARFARDFQYATDQSDLTKVINADIQLALDEAGRMVPTEIFGDQASYSAAFLLLAAHNLVTNIRASSGGLSAATPWLAVSKSAGGASVSYAIPAEFQSNPTFAMYALTPYGAKYLAVMLPYLAGGGFAAVAGATQP